MKSRVGKREDTLGGGDLGAQAQGRENGGILHAEYKEPFYSEHLGTRLAV